MHVQAFVKAGSARHRRKSTAHQEAMELVECEPSVPLCESASVRAGECNVPREGREVGGWKIERQSICTYV